MQLELSIYLGNLIEYFISFIKMIRHSSGVYFRWTETEKQPEKRNNLKTEIFAIMRKLKLIDNKSMTFLT